MPIASLSAIHAVDNPDDIPVALVAVNERDRTVRWQSSY